MTEVVITDRRVIYARGFIQRHSVELHMDKIESVDVDQSVLGRLFDYQATNSVEPPSPRGHRSPQP
jgi:uncharacterized membrane protein YdbT with pleckstrin-like domain